MQAAFFGHVTQGWRAEELFRSAAQWTLRQGLFSSYRYAPPHRQPFRGGAWPENVLCPTDPMTLSLSRALLSACPLLLIRDQRLPLANATLTKHRPLVCLFLFGRRETHLSCKSGRCRIRSHFPARCKRRDQSAALCICAAPRSRGLQFLESRSN